MLILYIYLIQVLQQCLLCKSWRNQQNRNELSWSGFPVWVGLPLECEPHHIPNLLLFSAKRDGPYATTTRSCCSRFFPQLWKIAQPPLVLQRRRLLPSKATTATSCLINLIYKIQSTSWWKLSPILFSTLW